jgi:hypothetical protein
MIDSLDELLAKARFAPGAPYTDDDIEAAHDRRAERIRRRERGQRPSRRPPQEEMARQKSEQELRDLCTVVVSAPRAIDELVSFATERLPGPVGGRVLGSILYLRARPESARFWWQYAADGGDSAAMYCLHLHHQAEGEPHQGALWREQMEAGPVFLQDPRHARLPDRHSALPERLDARSRCLYERMRSASGPLSVAQALRILKALRGKWVLSEELSAVMDYVSMAVGWVHPDVDLPLPADDFAQQVRNIIRCAPAPRNPPAPDRQPLEQRPRQEAVSAG